MNFLPVSRVIAGEAHAALRCLFGVSRARACDSARTTRLGGRDSDDSLGRRDWRLHSTRPRQREPTTRSDDASQTTRLGRRVSLRRRDSDDSLRRHEHRWCSGGTAAVQRMHSGGTAVGGGTAVVQRWHIGGTAVVKRSYSGGTAVSHRSYSGGTAEAQRWHSGGTAVVQRWYSGRTAVVQRWYSGRLPRVSNSGASLLATVAECLESWRLSVGDASRMSRVLAPPCWRRLPNVSNPGASCWRLVLKVSSPGLSLLRIGRLPRVSSPGAFC